jgi:thiol-disulfide isomerase/thioredoxin
VSQPPYMISKVISENKIVNLDNQKLLIIDFWATWCGPCAPATEQLEILQKSVPDDVFIVSVSDETEEIISKYLQRNPIRIAVLQDYLPNSLINLFKVKSRPYSVLLSLDGTILYQGHPANITAQMIKNYASQVKSQPKKNWNDLFYTVQNTPAQKDILPKSKELHIAKQPQTEKRMYSENGIFYYSGPLTGLIKYLANCSSYQIVLQGITDYGVSMSCGESELLDSKSEILRQVEKRLSINIQNGSKSAEAIILDTFNPKMLWDNKQINLSSTANSTYIVGTDRVEGDNMTLLEIANLLSEIKGNLYYYKGNDSRRYDWDFHYLYDNLMTEDFENSFGIKLKKETVTLPVYIVSAQ